MRIRVVTRDADLSALIEECLSGIGEVRCTQSCEISEDDVLIVDADTVSVPEVYNGRLTVISRNRALPYERLLDRPFLISDLIAAVGQERRSAVSLDAKTRTAHLDGRSVVLTGREFALLSALVDAKGEFVSREELLKSAFDGAADSGLVAVYIHYLRGKLERERRLIYSSRERGYRIITESYDA